jgi:glycosyltransferase involved in cell wall biosynthesis
MDEQRDIDATAWRPLRIAMVGQKGLPATYGGIEHHVEHIGRRLAERGHRVTVFCRSSYGPVPAGSYLGMHLMPAATVGTKHLDAIVHSATSTAKAMLAKADVIHYHGIGPGLVAPLPRYLSSAKVVMTIHGLDHQRAKWGAAAQGVLQSAHWLSGHVPDEVVVVSQALADHYREQFGREAVYIPNGVMQWPRMSEERVQSDFGLVPGRYALSVGRLVPEKRIDLLIKAFADVPGDFRLAIVGDSSFSDDHSRHLRALAADDPRVIFTGFAYGETLAALYQHAGVFTQPSALEGLPLTLLEAASHDAPVLVSDIPPHHEILGQGTPRQRMVPVDSQAHLTQALTDMLTKPAGRDRETEAWRQRILSRYSWDAATEQLESLYLSTVGRRQTSSGAAVTTRPGIHHPSPVGGDGAVQPAKAIRGDLPHAAGVDDDTSLAAS